MKILIALILGAPFASALTSPQEELYQTMLRAVPQMEQVYVEGSFACDYYCGFRLQSGWDCMVNFDHEGQLIAPAIRLLLAT